MSARYQNLSGNDTASGLGQVGLPPLYSALERDGLSYERDTDREFSEAFALLRE